MLMFVASNQRRYIGDVRTWDAAMTTIGRIQEFCPKTESFVVYIECVQLFFTANDMRAGPKGGTRISQCSS